MGKVFYKNKNNVEEKIFWCVELNVVKFFFCELYIVKKKLVFEDIIIFKNFKLLKLRLFRDIYKDYIKCNFFDVCLLEFLFL